MLTDRFDFSLPDALVALRPAEPRGSARLLVVRPGGQMVHAMMKDLPQWLSRGDTLVFNDSRVIAARLTGVRPPRQEGAPPVSMEVTLHQRVAADRFRAFVQPARRLRAGDRLDFGQGLQAAVLERQGGEVLLSFGLEGAALDQGIAAVGQMPLPPYISKRRLPDARDLIDYQTVYARQNGSVAAPTAGLHFTPQILENLASAGIGAAYLTLHVGAGTFLPVAADDTTSHVMHAERAMLDQPTAARLNAVHAAEHRIAAVGTTSLRTLESAASSDGQLHAMDRETDIFITPGYSFRVVDILLTNFHLPRSTLFMLVSAFMGLEVMQAAYAEAIREQYRFYSYGDACLLIRAP